MQVTTGLVMMRTKAQSGQTAWQCAITQRARALMRTMRHNSTAVLRMQVTTGLVMMRTKEQSGQTVRQCAITQRARALTRTMRHSSTASTVVLMNATGASATLSPASATAVAGASATFSPAAATTTWNGDGKAAEPETVDIWML